MGQVEGTGLPHAAFDGLAHARLNVASQSVSELLSDVVTVRYIACSPDLTVTHPHG